MEVQEFRDLLLAVHAENNEIGFEEVQILLGAIVPMGAKNISQLRQKFFEFASMQDGVDGSDDKLDFPEFLWLMRELLDSNFANMSEHARASVEQEEEQRRKEKEEEEMKR